MAALSVKQETPNSLVLTTPLAQRLSSIFTLVVLLGIGASLFDSILGNASESDPIIALVVLGVLFVGFRSLYSVLAGTTVRIDASARVASNTTRVLGFPIRQVTLPFDRIRRVVVASRLPVMLNQSSVRPVWQLVLEPTEGLPVIVNTLGTHDEMVALGNKVTGLVNRPLVDEMAQATNQAQSEQTYQPIEDFGGGTNPTYAPPVATPFPMGRSTVRPARPATPAPQPIPAPQAPPPPNTLTTDPQAREHAQFERQATESYTPSPASSDMASDWGQRTAAMSGMGDAGQPVMPALGTMGDMGQPPLSSSGMMGDTNQPIMPALGTMMDSGQPPLASSALPSAMNQPASPPLGGLSGGVEAAQPLYSPSPLGSPDQPPLGNIPSVATAIPDIPNTLELPTPLNIPADSGWVRTRSIQELQKAVADDPNDSQAYYQLGRFWHAQRAWDQAQEAYARASHLNPADAATQNDLGVLYMQRGRVKEAEAALRRTIGLDPFSTAGHYNLGLLLLRAGRRTEALQEFNRGMQSAANESEQRLFANARNGAVVDPLLI